MAFSLKQNIWKFNTFICLHIVAHTASLSRIHTRWHHIAISSSYRNKAELRLKIENGKKVIIILVEYMHKIKFLLFEFMFLLICSFERRKILYACFFGPIIYSILV